MTIRDRIDGFSELGEFLSHALTVLEEKSTGTERTSQIKELETTIHQAGIENPWFIKEHVLFALKTLALSLNKDKIVQWLQKYDFPEISQPGVRPVKTIGVVMAGNIPLVGFHDFICVLMAGHRFSGKLSSEDSLLLPALTNILIRINPGFKDLISFSKERLSGFDAVIATGSNNTFRYFEYYFGKYPHVLRKNRNGVAILTGKENPDQLSGLADDIFLYFGKGCRSVSKVYLPANYNVSLLQVPFMKYQHLFNHHKYRNNYDYYKAIMQVGSAAFHDFGFLLMKQEKGIASPISILNYEFYSDINNLEKEITGLNDQIQCVICQEKLSSHWIRPGNAQRTELWDYADGIDTMNFLYGL